MDPRNMIIRRRGKPFRGGWGDQSHDAKRLRLLSPHEYACICAYIHVRTYVRMYGRAPSGWAPGAARPPGVNTMYML